MSKSLKRRVDRLAAARKRRTPPATPPTPYPAWQTIERLRHFFVSSDELRQIVEGFRRAGVTRVVDHPDMIALVDQIAARALDREARGEAANNHYDWERRITSQAPAGR